MAKKWSASKPWRMWIDGKCFNIKPYDKIKSSLAKNVSPEKDIGCSTEAVKNSYIINPTDDGKLATKFRLPSRYYKGLTNFPQFSVKRLGQETQTEIAIPESGEQAYITISGTSETDIINARELIHSVVGEIREKEFVQQFFAIPVNSEEVKRSFEQFKEEILNGDPVEGMDASIFQSPSKLHLTVAVFSLLDDLEKDEAITALNDCKTQIIEPILKDVTGPVKIKVAGINCMQEDLSRANVLYAKAKIEYEKDEDILQKIANGISNFFYDRGLIRQYQENVKLHVTLLNTKYRKASEYSNTTVSPKRSKWYFKRKPFDARSIIEKYKDHYFGEAVLDCVHLSYMSSIGDDGFYKPLSIVTL